MTVLDTSGFEAHSPGMTRSAAIIFAFCATFVHLPGTVWANPAVSCGYEEVCEEPTTTVVATDEPPVPTTVSVPSTIGAINGPATVGTTIPMFVCSGVMVADVCVQPTTTTVALDGDDCMDDGTTRWSFAPCSTAVAAISDPAPLPVTGSGSQRIALLGLALFALAGVLYGVRWLLKRS